MLKLATAGRAVRRGAALLLVAVMVLALGMIAGCGASSATAPATGTPAMGAKSAASGASTTATTDPSVQLCAECGGLGKPAIVKGSAVASDGAQVVNVAIEGGYYVPNTFTVKSGMPVKVVFTGKAKGCVAKPKFASLNKSGDLTGTGSVTLELGTLSAGKYTFTCGMGANAGTITVE